MASIDSSFFIARQGMNAQLSRMKVVSENIANSQTTPSGPGEQPYRRRIVSFDEKLEARSGVRVMTPHESISEPTEKRLQHMPGHPGADANGMVEMPNVDIYVEMADMREANRSFQANIQAYKGAREIFEMQIDLLRSAR